MNTQSKAWTHTQNRRYIRDVVFLSNLTKVHYHEYRYSDKLLFCKERNVDYNLKKNDCLDLVSMYSTTNTFKYIYFIRIINE